MLHQTPKNYGSLGHGKRSPQKKATVTKFKGAHLLKWLTAFCVLDCVGAVAVPWSAELVASSGSNSSVSQRLGRALGDEPGGVLKGSPRTMPLAWETVSAEVVTIFRTL